MVVSILFMSSCLKFIEWSYTLEINSHAVTPYCIIWKLMVDVTRTFDLSSNLLDDKAVRTVTRTASI